MTAEKRSRQTSDGDRHFHRVEVDAVFRSARVRRRVGDARLANGQPTSGVADHVTRPGCRVDDVTVPSPLDAEAVRLGRVGGCSARHDDIIGGRYHLRLRPINDLRPLWTNNINVDDRDYLVTMFY